MNSERILSARNIIPSPFEQYPSGTALSPLSTKYDTSKLNKNVLIGTVDSAFVNVNCSSSLFISIN